MKTLFSLGNRKLPTTTAIFNLPAIETCPGATEECKRYCYARKAERIYRNVLACRQSALADSHSRGFAAQAISDLALLQSRGKINKVRIHESGDFYSQAYVNKWIKIASALPDLIFYAYTRSYALDFSKLQALSNVRLIFSLDDSSCGAAIGASASFARVSVVIGKHQAVELRPDTIVCPGDCKVCSICSSKNRYRTILFRKH